MGYYSNYISHHGIQGQEWGVKNGPPYPIEDGKHSKKEKKFKNKGENKKEEKKKTKEQEAYEEAKSKAIKSGNLDEIEKYAEDMTVEELNSALKKYRLMNELKNERPSKDAYKTIDDTVKKVRTVNGWADTGIKLYNTIAGVNNAFNSREMPVIRTNPNQNKKNKNRNNDKYDDFDDYYEIIDDDNWREIK